MTSRSTLFLASAVAVLGLACGETPKAPVSRPDGSSVFDDAGPAQCSAEESFCGDRCVTTASDPDHCGGCNRPCTGGTFCQGGECTRTCGAGLTSCGGACVDLARDPMNCARCGQACPSDRVCGPSGCECPARQALCGDRCVDVDTDRDNCGICGRACSAEQRCVAGSCACQEGLTLCAGACVDLAADAAHCGLCERACGADQTCQRSSCVCATGQTETACNDGRDDDCDRLVDCADPDCSGATRSCRGACGPGIETCDGAATWGRCEGGSGGAEICGDGIDQDCNGSDLRRPDRFEPNETCATSALASATLDPDVTLTPSFDSVDDDVDCFRFTTEDSSNPLVREYIEVRLTNVPAGHDYDLYLYRSRADCDARMTLASAVAAGNADDTITWAESFGTDDGGTYYLRVVRIIGASCGSSYSLRINGLR